jgi:two-component system, NarL family, invasion response regulator UvrY
MKKQSIAPIRVLIADDHPLIVQGLTLALHRHGAGRIEVVGTAQNGEQVAQQYQKAKADVLILDVRMGPGINGIELARQLLAQAPKMRIIFFSQFDQDEIICEAYRLGALAFITKMSPTEQLAQAVECVHTGEPYFLPDIAKRMALLSVRADKSPQSKLTPRELDVFKRMAEGFTNLEIAQQMDLSPKTISTISQHIKDQLGTERAAELTRLALRYSVIGG